MVDNLYDNIKTVDSGSNKEDLSKETESKRRNILETLRMTPFIRNLIFFIILSSATLRSTVFNNKEVFAKLSNSINNIDNNDLEELGKTIHMEEFLKQLDNNKKNEIINGLIDNLGEEYFLLDDNLEIEPKLGPISKQNRKNFEDLLKMEYLTHEEYKDSPNEPIRIWGGINKSIKEYKEYGKLHTFTDNSENEIGSKILEYAKGSGTNFRVFVGEEKEVMMYINKDLEVSVLDPIDNTIYSLKDFLKNLDENINLSIYTQGFKTKKDNDRGESAKNIQEEKKSQNNNTTTDLFEFDDTMPRDRMSDYNTKFVNNPLMTEIYKLVDTLESEKVIDFDMSETIKNEVYLDSLYLENIIKEGFIDLSARDLETSLGGLTNELQTLQKMYQESLHQCLDNNEDDYVVSQEVLDKCIEDNDFYNNPDFKKYIASLEKKYGLIPKLNSSTMYNESRGKLRDKNGKVITGYTETIDGESATGIWQITPGTAEYIKNNWDKDYSIEEIMTDPIISSDAASWLLRHLQEKAENKGIQNKVAWTIGSYTGGEGRMNDRTEDSESEIDADVFLKAEHWETKRSILFVINKMFEEYGIDTTHNPLHDIMERNKGKMKYKLLAEDKTKIQEAFDLINNPHKINQTLATIQKEKEIKELLALNGPIETISSIPNDMDETIALDN